ncbi:Uridine-cytidine kinase-like 1 [Diplodia seriata]|uniref:uridine/cytidine kinase n=1 Tax=Diplodia seriata TaxID=420778 RepID=A0A1S8BGY8_9PEZI|nr:Uridine-cytidine kinase-like 1 [Diplodia seriata]
MSTVQRAHYSPPWANTSIIGVAGSSGSGKTTLSLAIISALNLPWVVILSMVGVAHSPIPRPPAYPFACQDSFYKPLTPEQSARAFRNEYDFDAPEAIDFDLLVDVLRDIKQGKKVEVPVYSFAKHNREEKTTTIYSPHVLILEGIFGLHDQRVLDLLDLKIFADAEPDLCLSRRLVRDVKSRGRDIEGCIKQWFLYVKPNFHRYVAPQREVADLIVPRGVENTVAISMVTDRIHKILTLKSRMHQAELKRLGKLAEEAPLSSNVIVLPENRQNRAIHTLLINPAVDRENFIFYFDRICALLIEESLVCMHFDVVDVTTPMGTIYRGFKPSGETSAVTILRGGSALERAFRRVLPDSRNGRILIQTNHRTGEPELHYRALPKDIATHERVLLLDSQMSSGGAALMAVKILVDHGVPEKNIVFVTYMAGRMGVGRLTHVFPEIRVVVGRLVDDFEERWVEKRYFGH